MRHANSERVARRFPAAGVGLDEVEYWGFGMRVARYTTYSGIDIAETVDEPGGAGLSELYSRHNLLKRKVLEDENDRTVEE